MIDINLMIEGSGGKTFKPIVLDGITWETVRKGAPSKLEFSVMKDGSLSFSEGSRVQLQVNGQNVFIGFIFTKQRTKDRIIKCTAYDQLRYLKNKDTYVYTDKTASDVIRMIAKDFGLNTGSIADTGYRIALRDEDNQTLFDIILNALDLTLDATGKVYVLYDDFGKIALKNIEDMRLQLLIDNETAEDFDYTSSIDKDTYNKVKVIQENSKDGVRDVFDEQNDEHVKTWGVLQYFMSVQEGVNAQNLVNTILKAKDRKTRTLSIKGALGDISVRAGCSLPVTLDLGDSVTNNEYLMCEKVVHTFTADHHSMDIEFYNLKDNS